MHIVTFLLFVFFNPCLGYRVEHGTPSAARAAPWVFSAIGLRKNAAKSMWPGWFQPRHFRVAELQMWPDLGAESIHTTNSHQLQVIVSYSFFRFNVKVAPLQPPFSPCTSQSC